MAFSTAVCDAGGTKLDACKLLSATDVSGLLGSKITSRPVKTSAGGPHAGTMCSFTDGHLNGTFMLLVGRLQYSDAAKEVAWQKHMALHNTPPGLNKPTFDNISGLGDAAYLSKTGSYFQVHVLSHGNSIVVNYHTRPSAKAIAEAKKIARAALDNIHH